MTAAARKAFEEAVALETSGDLDNALVAYLKAQELSPQDTEIAYRTASALLQAGYLEEAQSQLRRIVFSEPDHLNAKASLGNCQLLLEDLGNAKQNFTEVLELAPDNRNALYGLASVLLEEDLPLEAAKFSKRLLELLPDTPEVLTLFADTQAKVKQNVAAIAAYRKALKSNPDFTPALLGLAETLLLRKRFDEVIELTISANQLAPADPLSLELLSDALAGKGALEDAREAAEAALKLNPRSQTNLVRLSVLCRKLGDRRSALDFALKGHDLNTKSAGPLNALGAALAALKYSHQARSVLTGLNAGLGLDPEVRKLSKELIAAKPEGSSNQATGSENTGVSPDADRSIGPAQDENIAVAPNGNTNTQGEGKVEESKATGTEAQTVKTPPAADDPLPNVLGLQRRDLT